MSQNTLAEVHITILTLAIYIVHLYRKYMTKQFHSIEGNIFPNYIDELKTSLIIS